MKIKNIFALMFSLGIILMFSTVAYAATDIKVEGAYMDSYGVNVPIVIYTTDDELDQLSSVQMTLNYDESQWSYYSATNDAYVTNTRGGTTTVGSIDAGTATGKLVIVYTNSGASGFAEPDEDGKIPVCTIAFDVIDSFPESVSDNDFTISLTLIEDYNTGGGTNNNVLYADDLTSYFTFAVTGNLDGNEIVGLAASTDGGKTKQELTKYVSTTLTEDDTDYASATTNFLVAVNNSQGSNAVVDITIYGIKADGTYVELGDYAQDDFLVQTFE